MIDLDDAAALAGADPQGMLDAVLALPRHCREGYEAGRSVEGFPSAEGATAIAFCGMGGSGISGDVLRALFRARLGIPVTVVKEPVLPEFCGKDTLVVCSSYSGNTSETLACFREAAGRGCRLVGVASGGELAAQAEEASVPVVPIPGGFQPRAALGFLSFGAMGALEAMGVIPALGADVQHAASVLEARAAEIGPTVPTDQNPSKTLARAIGDRFPVVWGEEGLGSVAASRWKTQMNENAKVPAFASAIPELDHNEVVGWSDGMGERFFLVVLRSDHEHPEGSARFDATVEVVGASGLRHEEVRASTASALSDLLWLVMSGDATSVYLAYLRGVDPTPVDAIGRIKAALAGDGSEEPG